MRQLRYLVLVVFAAVSVGAVSSQALGSQALGSHTLRAQAAPQQTNECNGIRECLRAQGPWVVVPARGEVLYLLDCPRRQGIVGGLDALSSSSNVQVQFEAQLGAPVAPGRTTTRYALFRAYSTNGRRGLFQPRIGCIRTSASPRSTTAVKATPGAPSRRGRASARGRSRSWRSAPRQGRRGSSARPEQPARPASP